MTLASGFADDIDALPTGTHARVVGATQQAGNAAEYSIGKDRRASLVPATGAVDIDRVRVNARVGAAIRGEDVIRDEDALRVTAIEDGELVLVDAA